MIIPTFLNLKAKRLHRFFRISNWPQILVAAVFLIILVGVFSAVFVYTYSLFFFLKNYAALGQAITDYILSVSWLVLTLALIISFIASAYAFLYRDSLLHLYLTTPVSTTKLTLAKFLDLWLFGSWPLGVVGLPVLLAYGLATHKGGLYFVFSMITILWLSLLTASLGASLTIYITHRLGRRSTKGLILLVVLTLIIGGQAGLNLMLPKELFKLHEAEKATTIISQLYQQPLMHPAWPHNFLRQISSQNNPLHLTILGLVTMGATLGLVVVAKKFYASSWQSVQEGNFTAITQQKVTAPKFSLRRWGIIGKDLTYIFRSQAEIINLSLIVFLGLVYFLVLSRVPLVKNQNPQWFGWIIIQAQIVIGYLLTTLSLRLVFPLLARERRAAWWVYTSPQKFEKFFSTRAIFWSGFFSLLGLILGGITAYLLGFDQATTITTLFLASFLGLVVAQVSLALGAVLPNRLQLDADQLATSFPGLLATVINLLLVILAAFFLKDGAKIPGKILLLGTVYLLFTSLLQQISLRRWSKSDF
ncbi:MAG: hypothetical protein Q8N84_03055 [bacterium]|nr:hypothetical protein [bacterium]